MKTVYKRTATTVSFINYHLIFCPKYRKKIFDIPNLENRFKEIVKEVCLIKKIEIIALECHHDHVHIFVSTYPSMSIPEMVQTIKGVTSYRLKREFMEISKFRNLWSRSYFVSTAGNVSSETVKWYVETQKTR